jgi:hypothetical protein
MMTEQARWELGLLALVAVIAGIMAGLSIHANDASGAAAWSALMMAIINTVKEGRQSRTIDRMQEGLQRSAPTPETPDRTIVEGASA